MSPKPRLTRTAARAGIVGLVATLLVYAPARLSPGAAAANSIGLGETDQLIVTTSNSFTAVDVATDAVENAGEDVVAERAFGTRAAVVKLDEPLAGADLAAVVAEVGEQPGVVSVEPDLIMRPTVTPNDPSLSTQWDFDAPVAGNYGADLRGAWDVTTGSSAIRVAVIDTGYLDHADLGGRFLPGYDFINDSRIGNDGDGRDSDAHDSGDWITLPEHTTSGGFFEGCGVNGGLDSSSWHGTHVAGTIGAATNNGNGVAGINWVSKIVPVRVLGKCGGYTSDITDGMRWAAGLAVSGVPSNPYPARVMNLSLGGSGACSATWQSAINAVTAVGAVVVVAAGNSNSNASGFSPASCSGVVTVASTGKAGNRAYYSNYGSAVEIAAQGGDGSADAGDTIYSTLNSGATVSLIDSFANYQGTSMATPHVAGVVSLMLSVNPALTPAQVLTILQSSATAFPGGSTCSTSTCGTGILNAASAVAAVASSLGVPYSPRSLAATPGASQVSLTWSAPTSSGASAISDYVVQHSTDGNSWTTFADGVSTVTAATVSGLAAGTLYLFRVAAVNGQGTGTTSAEVPGTPSGVPAAPPNVSPMPANSQVVLNWTAPPNGGSAITDYVVEYSTIGGSWTTFNEGTSASTTVTVSGLANGTTYFFHVAAINGNGQGGYSGLVTAMPRAVPDAPTGLTPTAGNGQVALTWSAPPSNGSPISDYVIQRSTDGVNWTTLNEGTSTATNYTATSLTNGTQYRFRVAAVNGPGTGAYSDVALATPFVPGGAPTGLVASPGNTQVGLSWTAPGTGGPFLDYIIEYSTNGSNWTVFTDAVSAVTNTVVTGLVNGTTYSLRVAAVNGGGQGPYATTSGTPRTVPDAPTSLTPTAGDTQVSLIWNAPAFNGGAPITDYVLQFSTNGTTWNTVFDGTSVITAATMSGLTNGTQYFFKVAAVNSAGTGVFGTPATSTPMGTPPAPTGLFATPDNTQVGLSWTAPGNDGGSPITDYVVQYSTNGTTWNNFDDGVSTGTTATVTGLPNGTSFFFHVASVNSAGTGLFSLTVQATPRTIPGAPNLTSATPGNGSVSLDWSAPASNGGAPITDYVVQYSTDGTTWNTFNDGTSSVSNATVTGLTNGTSYQFQVAATNAAGTGPYSSALSSTPRTTPGSPTGLGAAAGDAQVLLTWTAPSSDGGSAITDYVVQHSTNGTTWTTFNDGTSIATNATVTGLANGTNYLFRVSATNVAGTGSPSGTANATPRTVPSAPTGLITTPGNGFVGLTWTAPFNGGSAITDYVVEHSTDANSWTTFADGTSATTNATVTGLVNGTAHQFRVSATNVVGTGGPSGTANATPRTVPGAPTDLQATPGNAQVVLAWTTPDSDGGSALTDYVIEHSTDGTNWNTFNDGTSTVPNTIVTGLANGITYQFKVRAVNLAGSSESSAPAGATPRTVPFAPSQVLATPGSTLVDLTWTAPASDGGSPITDYVVQHSTDGTNWTTFNDGTSTNTNATVTGLTNGTAYQFRVLATNVAGDSNPSTAASATPRTVPGPPTALAATPGNTQAALNWTAPSSDGGSPITDYVVQHSTDGTNWTTFNDGTSTNTNATVTGLTNGTSYQFRVLATNAAGNSNPSTTATTTPRTVPGPPTGLAATPGDTQVALTWTAPSSDGGSPITDYVVQHSTDGTNWTTFNDGTSTATNATVTGLTNGTSYQFRVLATNAAGNSIPSTTATTTPRTVPSVPTGLVATAANSEVDLTWTAPLDGGSPITDYLVQYSTDAINWSTVADGTSTNPSAAVTGLTNGTQYSFRVAAVNAAGSGNYTAPVPAVPLVVPSQPQSLVAEPGIGSVGLTWSAPLDSGGSTVTDYVVQFSTDGVLWTTFTDGVSTTTNVTVTPLVNGVPYSFRVAAVNTLGPGAPSAVATATPRTVPGIPTGLGATPANASAALSWTAPSTNGGASITDYVVQHSTDGTNWTTFNDGSSTATNATVTGLTNGTNYLFRVSATNVAGTGSPSSTANATPRTVPGAPTAPSATPGNTQVALVWSAPSSDGGSQITDYVVQHSTDGTNWTTFNDGTSTNTNATVTGLTNGVQYLFIVTAVNVAGPGTASGATASTPFTVPGVPTGLGATPGNSLVALAWTAPVFDGGRPVTDYVVQHSTDGTNWTTFNDGTSTATNATVTGLTNGTNYQFRIAATNLAGTGNPSNTANATPRTMPGPPTGLATTPGDTQVALAWTAPSSDGGSPLTDYVVQHSTDGTNWTTFNDGTSTATNATVTGLTNGTNYQFRIAATNLAGTGNPSNTANATPRTMPGPPTGLATTPGDTQVALAWTAPSSDGGSPLTDYVVQHSTDGTNWTTFNDGTSTATNATVTGLTNGTNYQFRVLATSTAGTGNPSAAIAATPFTIPNPPTAPGASPGNGTVAVSWTAPAFNGGRPVTDYVVQYSTDGTNWTTFNDGTSTATNATVTGLTNGTNYQFRIAATNLAGTGNPSNTANATPRTMPGSPTGLVPTPGLGQVALAWTAPSFDGGSPLTDYVVQYSTNGTNWTTFNDGVSTLPAAIVSGLQNGTQYILSVAAVNVAGTGGPGLIASTPFTTPNPPTALVAAPGVAQVTLNWVAPAFDGGRPVTDYVVEYSTNGSNWTTFVDGVSDATIATVTGLTNATQYQFRVASANVAGAGAPGTPVGAMPRTVPNAPTALTATPSDGQIALSWAAPFNGGAPITDYIVQVSYYGHDWETLASDPVSSATSVVVSAPNGLPHRFQIAAVNVAGTGPMSTVIEAAAYTVPGATFEPVATPSTGFVDLVWGGPSFDGGSPVTSFVVQQSSDGSQWTVVNGHIPNTNRALVGGLDAGATYWFRVAAVNPAGTGAFSPAVRVALPSTKPVAPLISPAPQNGAVNLAWSLRSNGGFPVTDYVVQRSTNGTTWTTLKDGKSAKLSFVIKSLTNGKAYRFRVAAINALGQGPWSPIAIVVPRKAPGTPRSVTLVRGNGQVKVSWKAPTSNGGAAVTDYVVQLSRNGTTWTTVVDPVSTSTTLTVTGLINGAKYWFRVAAINAAGTGTYTAKRTVTLRA